MKHRMLFSDDTTAIEELIAEFSRNPLHLFGDEAIIADDSIVGDNHIYSPQTPASKPWTPSEQDLAHPELGLLESGALDQGIGIEKREEILKKIAREQATQENAPHAEHKLNDDPDGTYITMRLEEDGYTITEINLHRYAQDCGYTPDNMIIVLPSSYEGVPVVRLSGGAMRGFLTNGVDIRLLITSDKLQSIRPNAFASLSVRNLYISPSVEEIGPQEFSVTKATVVPSTIDYIVDERSEHYCSCEGSLYSKDKTSLLFQKWPYPRELWLPEGLERIESAAFISGAPGPAVIHCPDSLYRVNSKPSPDLLWNPASLWECPRDSQLARQLNSLRPNTIHPGWVEIDDFYYDITAEGEAVLARSPRKCDRVVLPEEVDGHPVVELRQQSFPRRLKALIIPRNVRRIGPHNMLTGLTELYLPEGIEEVGEASFRSRCLAGVVNIPTSLHSIGRGCFESALVRFESCGSIVQVSPRLEASCFIGEAPRNPETGEYDCEEYDGIPFDFAAYDAYLLSSNHVPDRMGAILLRLAVPYKLSDDARDNLLSWLTEREEESIGAIARTGDVAMLSTLCDMGFITEDNIEKVSEECRRIHKTDAVLFLMEYKNEHFGSTQNQSALDRFAL